MPVYLQFKHISLTPFLSNALPRQSHGVPDKGAAKVGYVRSLFYIGFVRVFENSESGTTVLS